MATLIETIKQLREETGAGVLATRKALEQTDGNYTQALSMLREKSKAAAAKRSDHQASQGAIELYAHGSGRLGVMVEINTETDFAARSQTFRSFAHEIALQIAAAAPTYVRDEDIPAAEIEHQSEIAAIKARSQGKSETLVARIAAGYLEKYRDETVLLRQVYIRDEQVTIAQLLEQAIASVGENIVIRRFVRWELAGVEGDV